MKYGIVSSNNKGNCTKAMCSGKFLSTLLHTDLLCRQQWINNSTAEDSVDTAVAIPGNILTSIVSIFLKKYTIHSPLWSPLSALS